MTRVVISPVPNKDGEYQTSVDPLFMYLDASAWIDIFREFSKNQVKVIELIRKAIGNKDFKVLISVINFLELIGTKGEISENFSSNNLKAIENICLVSACQTPMIIEQEIVRFLDKTNNNIRILDPQNVALKSMSEGTEHQKSGNISWFLKIRKEFDELAQRDRTLDLEADIQELSGRAPSFGEVHGAFDNALSGNVVDVINRKTELTEIKQKYKGRKNIPDENSAILKYARNRITRSIITRHGKEKVSMVISNPRITFPGRAQIIKDFGRSSALTFQSLKRQMPGLYWLIKISFDNSYFKKQRSGGQMGDRNHAVYIPYSDYFASSDRIFVNALKIEHSEILKKGNLHLFKIQ